MLWLLWGFVADPGPRVAFPTRELVRAAAACNDVRIATACRVVASTIITANLRSLGSSSSSSIQGAELRSGKSRRSSEQRGRPRLTVGGLGSGVSNDMVEGRCGFEGSRPPAEPPKVRVIIHLIR